MGGPENSSTSYKVWIGGKQDVYKPDRGSKLGMRSLDNDAVFTPGMREAWATIIDEELGTDVVARSVWRSDLVSDQYGELGAGTLTEVVPDPPPRHQMSRDAAEKMLALDLATGQMDRHSKNWMGDVAIDHNLTFPPVTPGIALYPRLPELEGQLIEMGAQQWRMQELSTIFRTMHLNTKMAPALRTHLLESLNDKPKWAGIIDRMKADGMSATEAKAFQARLDFLATKLEGNNLIEAMTEIQHAHGVIW